MAKVLMIKAHPHVEESISISVGDYFIKEYQKLHPEDEIIIHDLFSEKVPPLNDLTMQAWKHQRNGQPLSDEEKDILEKHNQWLNEFLEADKYVFVNPMYNFFIPAEMK